MYIPYIHVLYVCMCTVLHVRYVYMYVQTGSIRSCIDFLESKKFVSGAVVPDS
jgi:hypothetical protein